MNPVGVSSHVREHYDRYYEGGASEWRRLGALDKARNIVELCQSIPHATIVEIGAGDGAVLQQLNDLRFGDRLHAVEISRTACEAVAGRDITRLIECRLYDGSVVPYEAKSFDLAILSHVVEHLEHPRQLILEAKRIASHVFVEVPTEDNIRMRRDYHDDGVGHINFYSPTTIRLLVQTCGLAVIDQRTFNPSIAIYEHMDLNRNRRVKDGPLRYYLKEALLRAAPQLAPRLLTFHSALLCREG